MSARKCCFSGFLLPSNFWSDENTFIAAKAGKQMTLRQVQVQNKFILSTATATVTPQRFTVILPSCGV